MSAARDLALLALGVALGAGAALLVRPLLVGDAGDARADGARDEARTLEARVHALEAEKAVVEKALAAAREDAGARLAAAPSRPEAPPSPPAAPPVPPAPPAVPLAAAPGPRFALAGFEDLAKGLDWAQIGKNLRDMPAATAAFADSFSKTGQYDADLVGRLQELNGPLVTAALKVNKTLQKDQANTAFTHPAFFANAIAAALEAAGMPLSEAQAKAVEQAAVEASAEEARLEKGYDDRTWALEKVLDESGTRERFLAAAFAVLSPEQAGSLSPPATKGRLQVDLFSSGLIWITRAGPLPFSDREGLVAGEERFLAERASIPDVARPTLHEAVVEWADGLPADVRDVPADALSQKGFLPVSQVLDSARRELAVLRRVVDVGRLDEAQARKVREVQAVLVPVRAPPPEPR